MVTVHLTPVLIALFPVSVVGVGLASWLDGDDEGEDSADEDITMDDFDDDDDFGGMDDFDDDFGGMDDMEGGEVSTAELETRIEDLEAEIANVSSTANTVRSENEQISEKVDEVEENVRKLLEIYEMVTRGVNPFVDEVGSGMGMGGESGGFGLFEGNGDEEQDEEDLDDELAGADAEDFFDDDAFDEIEDDDPTDADFAEDAPVEASDDTSSASTEGSGGSDSGGGGTSFEELKAEYESGEADWADEIETDSQSIEESEDVGFDDERTTEEDASGAEGGDLFQEDDLEATDLEDDSDDIDSKEGAEGTIEETGGDADGQGDDLEPSSDPRDLVAASGTAPAESDSTDDASPSDEDGTPFSQEEEAHTAAESHQADSESVDAPGSTGRSTDRQPSETTTESTAEAGATRQGDAVGGFQFGIGSSSDGQSPYLSTPPDGYLADVVVLEWLSFLLEEFDARNAVRAINYYQRIGWIGEEMRAHLITVMMGLTDSEYLYRDEFGSTDLTMTDHKRSLEYLEELAGGNLDRRIADRLDGLRA